MNNRIRKYILDEDKPKIEVAPKCLVVIYRNGKAVHLSYRGMAISWTWSTDPEGVRFSEREAVYEVEPLAAEAFVAGEVAGYISNLDVDTNSVVFVDELGVTVDELHFHPPILGNLTDELKEKKHNLTYLYLKFATNKAELTEDILGEAQKLGLLKPFLSLINLIS